MMSHHVHGEGEASSESFVAGLLVFSFLGYNTTHKGQFFLYHWYDRGWGITWRGDTDTVGGRKQSSNIK